MCVCELYKNKREKISSVWAYKKNEYGMPLKWKSCLVAAAINKRLSTWHTYYVQIYMSIDWVRFCQSLYTIWHTHTTHIHTYANCKRAKRARSSFLLFFFSAVCAIRIFSLSSCLRLKKLTNQRLALLPPSSPRRFFFSICTHNRQNTGSYIKIVNISLESAFCNRLDYTYTRIIHDTRIQAVFVYAIVKYFDTRIFGAFGWLTS